MRSVPALLSLSLSALVAFGAAACGGDDDAIEGKLSVIQSEIFTPKCATAPCHGTAIKPHLLSLADGKSYAQLVSVASTLNAGHLRVKPGKPDDSLVVKNLSKAIGKVRKMPPVGDRLGGAEIEAIRQWVAAGAKDD